MPYCVASDVQAIEAGRRLIFSDSPATVPSLTQVNNFILQIGEEINQTILRAGYLVPVTATAYLTQCTAMGSAWMVELALGVSGNAEMMKTIDYRYAAYQNMLSSIKLNPRLAGAVPATGLQNNIATSDGVTGYKNQNAPFQINRKDW